MISEQSHGLWAAPSTWADDHLGMPTLGAPGERHLTKVRLERRSRRTDIVQARKSLPRLCL